MNHSTCQQVLARTRGRPREFDLDTALDRAILYFREQGYHGVSIADLSAALQLSSGSIYKAFHNKQGLFTLALERYVHLRGEQIAEITAKAATGRDALRNVLAFYAESSSAREGRGGCLIVMAAVELASSDEQVRGRVARALQLNEQRLVRLIQTGQADGSIASQLDADRLAQMMLALMQGMRVLGKTGQTQEVMEAMVEQAMALLP